MWYMFHFETPHNCPMVILLTVLDLGNCLAMEVNTDFSITKSLLDEDVEALVAPKSERKYLATKQILFVSSVTVLAIVCIVLFADTRSNNKASVNRLEGPPALSSYLFDLESDPTETTNLYRNANYAKIAAESTANATAWLEYCNDPQVPNNDGQKEAFDAAGGIVPWRDSDVEARNITQKYSYSGAPHIVFFFVDDWGYNDAGFQSTYMNWTTPNIDALMRKGIRLTNYYTHETCVPSRAALMTGRYAGRFGMNEGSSEIQELPLSECTLGEEMKSAGYETYLIGKWHLGTSMWPLTPTYRGFDYFYGYYSGFIDYWTKKASNGYFDLTEMRSLVTDTSVTDNTVYSASVYQQKAEEIIKDHATNKKDKPMFLYYSSQLCHNPVEAPSEYVTKCADATSTTDEATYCAQNLALDQVVGDLTCTLKENGMYENTLFVLASDNGGANPMKGSNFPWKGGKGSVFRGGSTANAFVYGSTNIIPADRQGTKYNGLMHVSGK